MSGFIASSSYHVTTENEVSIILSHFNFDYIYELIENSIIQKDTVYQNMLPNNVAASEQYFKQLKTVYNNPENLEKIENTRLETYRNILEILANKYSLEVNYGNIQDYYSITYYLYDLLVSNFINKMVTFFTNYIIKERNTLYDVLQLNDLKKSKDATTIYNKKLYKNTKLAIINANLEYVMDCISGFDITFDTILNLIYQDKNMIKFIENIISPRVNFYSFYINLLRSPMRPIILTNIRLSIQNLSIDEDINIPQYNN